MAKIPLKINSILGGVAPTFFFASQDQYSSSIAIDPDFPVADTGTERSLKASGIIRPVAYEKFSGSNLNALPIAVIRTPKGTTVYIILENGRIISYSSSLGSETLVGTCAGSTAQGAFYYNNFIYITGTGASTDDISRYGPLDGSPSLTDGVWKGATLGSQTALKNSTYPNYRGGAGQIPKHWGHVHSDNKAYFCDFDSTSTTDTTRGKGLIHYIQTKYGSAQGDTNDGSAYAALDLPYDFKPVAIESFGEDLVIAAVQASDTTIDQGRAYLFFWDTFSDSFYRSVPLPDPYVTALLNNNGALYIWGGKLSSAGGYSLYQYAGGFTVSEIANFDEGHPPLQGAIDSLGDKVAWGSWMNYPDNSAGVWSYGSKDRRITAALHHVATSTADVTSSAGFISAMKYLEQASNAKPQLVLGWRGSANFGADKLSTTYQTHYWRSQVYNLGQDFIIKKIKIPLGAAVAANMTLVPKIFIDDASGSTTLKTINSTNFPNSERQVTIFPDVNGRNNFFLELKWSGTALLPVLLPIQIEIETKEP